MRNRNDKNEDTDADTADESYLANRRAKRKSQQQRNVMLLGAVVVVGLAVVGAGVVAVWAFKASGAGGVVGTITGPSADREGQEWTPIELMEYVNSKGMNCKQDGIGKAMFGYSEIDAKNLSEKTVTILKTHSTKEARDMASVRKEWNAINWGKFVVFGDAETTSTISKILGSN